MPRAKEKELIDLLCNPKNAAEIAEKHGLDKENVLVLKELSFPRGRADVVIYGLYRDLYVVPIGIEVKSRVMSETRLLQYITQIRKTYGYAFAYTCLVIGEISESVRELAEKYLSKLCYCFIEVIVLK